MTNTADMVLGDVFTFYSCSTRGGVNFFYFNNYWGAKFHYILTLSCVFLIE